MHSLRLNGVILGEVFEGFGVDCPSLTHLILEPISLQCAAQQELEQLQPNVRYVIILERNLRIFADPQYRSILYDALTNVSAYTLITHIDPDSYCMKEDTWADLASSLKSLISKTSRMGPAAGVCLPNLEHVAWSSDIQGASSLLLAAPNLKVMDYDVTALFKVTLLVPWNSARGWVQVCVVLRW